MVALLESGHVAPRCQPSKEPLGETQESGGASLDAEGVYLEVIWKLLTSALASFTREDVRHAIADLLCVTSSKSDVNLIDPAHPSVVASRLLSDLTATSSTALDLLEYDVRLSAYRQITPATWHHLGPGLYS